MRILFLDWFCWCFVPEVREYLASKWLTFKVLLILGNVHVATQNPMSSTPQALKWSTCPQMSLLVKTAFMVHNMQDSMERTVKAMQENPTDHESLKGLHHCNSITVTEKAIKPKTNSSWRKLCSDVTWLHRIYDRADQRLKSNSERSSKRWQKSLG